MKILFITNRFPYPPYQGDRMRAYHQLRLLSLRHEVTLLTVPPDRDEAESLQAMRPLCARMDIVSSPRWKRWARMTRAPFSSLPLQTLYSCDAALAERASHLITETAYDVAHVQLVRCAPVAAALGNVPVVMDLIDALSLNMERRAQRESGLRRTLFTKEAARVKRAEQDALRSFCRLVVCSPVDREAIGTLDHLHVIPNGVESRDFTVGPLPREPATIIFTGRMSYHPNVDAVRGFAREIWPLVLARLPQARFMIVGADPAPSVRQLGRLPGIEVVGQVPDLNAYLRRATVAVAPLRSGSGIQNKVLEAMAAGTPVVATPYALGGISATHGEHLLSATEPSDFADQVIRLINNPLLARHIAYGGRELVEQRYSWERSVTLLEEIYDLARPTLRLLKAA